MKKSKTIMIALIAILGITGGVKIYRDKAHEELNMKVEEEKKETPTEDKKEEETTKQEEEKKEENNNTEQEPEKEITTNQVSNQKPSTVKPGNQNQNTPSIIVPPSNTETPTIPEEPITPEDPTEEILEDLTITNDMLTNGVYQIANKKYKTLTIAEDIENHAKIVLDSIELKEKLVLENPGKYQLDITNATIPFLYVKDSTQNFARLFRSAIYKTMNKALEGATINVGESKIDYISINKNVEINGTNTVSTIEVNNSEEVVLNIPSQNVIVNTTGVVAINQKTETLLNQHGASLVVNAPIENLTNRETSTIRINGNNTITTFNNKGENTIVAGSGSITNANISASNTRIYANVTNKQISEDVEYVLIREEENINIVDAYSKAQGSVTFTLSEAVELSLKDTSVICNAGKSITLFKLTTEDNKTYTLSTSYFKNDSYALYITLPNGNIISKDFATDYANPTIENVVVERISKTEANLKLYGVDEGGKIYYILKEATARENITADMIKESGYVADVKVGFNNIALANLSPNVSYQLYYVVEGYFNNTGKVNGPIEIESQEIEVTPSKYEITYAKEEISNRFVFKLNRIPEKELTLEDFEIDCPSDSSLTIEGATFYVSPDLLTYIIEIPSNYGHKDNEYTIKIKVSENETIEKDFVTHLNPPVITGAVDNVKRISETEVEFKFNSDEAGTVYYGIYEWNGGIYDYNSTTPFASDVLTGKIASKSQKLNAGANTIQIDLSGINVTNNTQLWALYVDAVGNYRVGFVEHYKIPEYVETEKPLPESTLEITNMSYTNKSFTIEFNEEVLYNITQDDVVISVVGQGALPTKLMLIIDNSMSKKVKIEIGNYTLPVGEYQIEISATDLNEKTVKLVKKFEIKETIS